MQVAVVKAGGANFGSVVYALDRLGARSIVTDDPEIISQSDKVILPGVGSAQAAMQRIQAVDLAEVIKRLNQPTLAICLGMQTLCESSEEGDSQCLGILPIKVKAFDVASERRVPHMGWNQVEYKSDHPLYKNIEQNTYAYFVHGYYLPKNEYTIATCNYGVVFSAGIQYENFYAVQYHPERSAQHGHQLLKNFLEL